MRLDELDKQLEQVSRDILDAADDYKAAALAEARSNVAHKLAYARALLEAEGTVDVRKAKADEITAKQFEAKEINEAVAKGARAAFDACRDALSALQTRAGLFKSEMGFDRTGPQPRWSSR